MNLVDKITNAQLRKDVPNIKTGATVKVNVKIQEGDKTRIQAYEGIVIGTTGSGIAKTFTVRKNSNGVGVERVFPVHSPIIDSIEVIRYGKVRRGKLYYLRGRSGKASRIEEKR